MSRLHPKPSPQRPLNGPRSRGLAALGVVAALLASATSGCGRKPTLPHSFPVNQAPLANVLARAERDGSAAMAPVVVGVAERDGSLFAYDLRQQRERFHIATKVDGSPLIAGHFVASVEGQTLRLRELQTGTPRFETAMDGMFLVGADGDDRLSATVLSTGGSLGARSRLLVLDQSGVRLDVEIPRALGKPAVQGGLIFLPHSQVHLSVMSPDGEELVRLRVHDDVASAAFAHRGKVYFGQQGMYRLDAATPAGVVGGAPYFALDRAARRRLPAAPAFLPDTSQPPPASQSATRHIGLHFVPAETEGGGVGLLDDAVYLTFYRQLYALDSSLESALWVHETPHDVVGAQATAAGLVAVDAQGAVYLAQRNGALRKIATLPRAARATAIRADALAGAAAEPPARSQVEKQLAQAASSEDTRLAPIQQLAVRLLTKMNSTEATAALVSLCAHSHASERVRSSACSALSAHVGEPEPVLLALAQRADYLAQRPLPPLTPLADAARNAKSPRAAGLLLAHLEDPATPASDLPALASALGTLAGPSDVKAMSDFVWLYHAEQDSEPLSEALVLLAEGVARLDSNAGREQLAALLDDPLTAEVLRRDLPRVLAGTEPEEPVEPEPQAAEPSEPEQSPERPRRLQRSHVTETLRPAERALSECLLHDSSHPVSARLTLVVSPEGEVVAVRALPESAQPCMADALSGLRFPTTRYSRNDTVTYTVTR